MTYLHAATCEGGCTAADHVACSVCGGVVCLGLLSREQRDRALWRAKVDGEPIAHDRCLRAKVAA